MSSCGVVVFSVVLPVTKERVVKKEEEKFNEQRERQIEMGGGMAVPFRVGALYIAIFFVTIVEQIGRIVDSLTVV